MEGRIANALIDDLELVVDLFDNESVRDIFLGELLEKKADMIENLIREGGDEYRFKIQMIDEIFEIREDIIRELKTRKGQME